MIQGSNLRITTYHLTDLGLAALFLICEMATSPPTFRVAVRALNPVLNNCEEPNKGLALEAGASFLTPSF